jgi:lipopolysaccharide biosynthesis glycosyltransferase
MTSIFSRTTSRVRVTLLHDETLTEDNRERLARTGEVFGQEVRFVDVSEPMVQFGGGIDKICGACTRAALYRLLIPNLPELTDVSKIIYLDSDVVVNLDIAELWNVDIGDFPLGVVTEDWVTEGGRQKVQGQAWLWAMRIDARNYFNSGVLLMNLNRIRQTHDDMAKECVAFLKRYRLCAVSPDQDFLNAAFRGTILCIDGRFNRTMERQNIENAILHFGGALKPWVPHSWESADYLYWDCFARSEWRDQIVPSMLEMCARDPYSHRHVSDCVKHFLVRLKIKVVTNGLLKAAKSFATCAVEIFYRMGEKWAGGGSPQ